MERCSEEVFRDACPRTELARAETRDKAQADLTPAIATWTKATPPASATQESAGPVAFALAAAGMQVGGWSQLIASLIMAIFEGGAIIVPMLIGAASRAGARVVATRAASTPQTAQMAQPSSPTTGANYPPAPPRFHLASRAFLLDQVEPAQGERVQSSSLYLIYTTWKKDTSRRGFKPSEEPMTIVQFGKLLSKPIGLNKPSARSGNTISTSACAIPRKGGRVPGKLAPCGIAGSERRRVINELSN